MTLTPAYGRDYKSKKAVQADWDANKDFVIADIFHPGSGMYVNRQNLQEDPRFTEKTVLIRYNRLTQIQPFKV